MQNQQHVTLYWLRLDRLVMALLGKGCTFVIEWQKDWDILEIEKRSYCALALFDVRQTILSRVCLQAWDTEASSNTGCRKAIKTHTHSYNRLRYPPATVAICRAWQAWAVAAWCCKHML